MQIARQFERYHRVDYSAILSDFSLIAGEGFYVPHLDATEPIITEKILLVLGIVLHYVYVEAGSALQGLVAWEDALRRSQILEVVVVEFIGVFRSKFCTVSNGSAIEGSQALASFARYSALMSVSFMVKSVIIWHLTLPIV